MDEEPKKNKRSNGDVAKKDSHENGYDAIESKLKKKKKKKQKQLTAKIKKGEAVSFDDDLHTENTDSQKIKKPNRDTKNTGKVKVKSKNVKLSKGNNNSSTADKGQTEDGFKIVSSIPEDDSDISDAFESCSDYDEDDVKDNQDTTSSRRQTDDGFKIVSSIPEDDSDISDAFESCSDFEDNDVEDEQSTTSSRRQTEDGFKIVTDIPPDDSDISDAFEEDEEDELADAYLGTQQRDIKTPLLQIMDDFGKN